MQTNILTGNGSKLQFRPIIILDGNGRIERQNRHETTIPPNGMAIIELEIIQQSWLMYILRAPFRLISYLIWA
jgi:hypothetical protein